MPTIEVKIRRLTKAQLKAELRSLPAIFKGAKRDTYGIGRVFRAHFVQGMFTQIEEAFLAKSNGGADSLGTAWKPLSPQTIAARPLEKGERKTLGTQYLGRSGHGLLTAAQAHQWAGIFASTFARLSHYMPEGKAKAEAGRLAWAIMKSRGAQTKLAVYGRRKVPLLRVTDRLYNSLCPGPVTGDAYHPPREQVCRYSHGSITIGTRVPYAAAVHKKRPLWPSTRRISPWVREASRRALERTTKRIQDAYQ